MRVKNNDHLKGVVGMGPESGLNHHGFAGTPPSIQPFNSARLIAPGNIHKKQDYTH